MFGTVNLPHDATFVLPDGQLLGGGAMEHSDVAHQVLSTESGHLDVPEILPEYEDPEADSSTARMEHYVDDLHDFQDRTGAIRISGFKDSVVVDVEHPPTTDQIQTLKDFYTNKMVTVNGPRIYEMAINRALRSARY